MCTFWSKPSSSSVYLSFFIGLSLETLYPQVYTCRLPYTMKLAFCFSCLSTTAHAIACLAHMPTGKTRLLLSFIGNQILSLINYHVSYAVTKIHRGIHFVQVFFYQIAVDYRSQFFIIVMSSPCCLPFHCLPILIEDRVNV